MSISLRRRLAVALAVGAVVSSGTLSAAEAAGRTPAASAVVSLERGVSAESLGVSVHASYPHVGAALVSAKPAQLVRLAARPGVRSVVPDRVLRPTSGSVQSGDGMLAPKALGGRAGAPDAGAGVTIALVDTGVSDTVALNRSSGRLIDGVDTSAEGYADDYGHGTFLATVIAGGAVAATEKEAMGVAPAARVVNVKVAGASGTTSLSRVVAGLDWVVAHASTIDVAAFAFSGQRPGEGYGPDPLTDAVDRVRDAGVAVVVSAGNSPGVVGDPGFSPRVLTVGAADLAGRREVASFSGSAMVAGVAKPDLVAAGVRVFGLLPESSSIARAYPAARQANGLWRGSGTSQATASAAGAVALFLQDHPNAPFAEVKASLRGAARPIHGPGSGAGLLAIAGKLLPGTDDPSAPGGGTGEGGFDANSWSANSWSANSWSANSWSANSWSANSWSANSWSANSWS